MPQINKPLPRYKNKKGSARNPLLPESRPDVICEDKKGEGTDWRDNAFTAFKLLTWLLLTLSLAYIFYAFSSAGGFRMPRWARIIDAALLCLVLILRHWIYMKE